MKFKVKTTARPAGYILHSEREQIYFIDIIYIYIYIYIYTYTYMHINNINIYTNPHTHIQTYT